MLVAPGLSEQARKEALGSDFLVIEVNDKVEESNVSEALTTIYRALSDLFTGIAPQWLHNLARSVREIADEVEEIGEELYRLARRRLL